MRKFIYILLTFAFVFILFRLVDVEKSLSLVKEANFSLILFSIILGLLGSLLGASRLKTLISVIGEVQISYIWFLGYAGGLISLIFPFSLGGFAMAYFVAKKLNISYKKSFTILFTDFALGVLLTTILALIAIAFFAHKRLLSVKTEVAYPYLIAILALAFFAIYTSFFRIKGLKNALVRLKKAFVILVNSKVISKVLFFTLLIGFSGYLQSYLYFLAFDMRPHPLIFALASSLFTALSYIPGAIAKIGQYETFGLLTLPYLLNLDKNAVFAVLIVSHAVSIITISALGVFSLFYLKIDREVIKNISNVVKRGMK